jgi:hypothetical protein
MPRHADDFDADDEFEEDVDDGSDDGDSAVDDDDEPTIPCPFCKAEICADAPPLVIGRSTAGHAFAPMSLRTVSG